MECRGCGRELTHGNKVDALCGDNRGRVSCTMRAFLYGEDAGHFSRPVESGFWTSTPWLVAVDEWLSLSDAERTESAWKLRGL
jgi:hypothetical protein